MKFTKMHGIGNDYVYVNCFEEKIENPSQAARIISDRHFGVGSDGLVLIQPADKADFFMAMYNPDGSQAEMCGNAIRCVGKYVYDFGLTDKKRVTIDTLAGIKVLDLTVENDRVSLVRVNMGQPILEPQRIPVLYEGETCIQQPIMVDGQEYRVTCVSMGNPHAVVYMDDVEQLELEKMGPLFEAHEKFPARINTEFVRVIDRKTLQMRVWERGTGETLACGTGACAVAVSSVLNGLTEEEVTVKLIGGDLRIQWDRNEDVVYMTGSAETVFHGEINI
ncbi:MAG: diaminopimelate epimerase [Lachnospiraceae bacterium]|nr:diaminopimelate epimerase [Lachnospiraceae bacterium]